MHELINWALWTISPAACGGMLGWCLCEKFQYKKFRERLDSLNDYRRSIERWADSVRELNEVVEEINAAEGANPPEEGADTQDGDAARPDGQRLVTRGWE